MRIVVALGGNALAKRGQPMTAEMLRHNIRSSVVALGDLARDNEVVITHGNGPQVGLLALQGLAYNVVPPYPLDILVAESQGMIGYPLQEALSNELGVDREVVTVLTTTQVYADDPGFENPTKPVGPLYTESEARGVEQVHGWQTKPDGSGFRRVVPSPKPVRILESSAIAALLDSGRVVICVGGGGVPVTIEDGISTGVEAVVDKDLASAELAVELGADTLLILTDGDYVIENWGEPTARAIAQVSPEILEKMSFSAGTMAPKVAAAIMVANAGGRAFIGPLDRVPDVLAGTVGTQVRQGIPEGIVYSD